MKDFWEANPESVSLLYEYVFRFNEGYSNVEVIVASCQLWIHPGVLFPFCFFVCFISRATYHRILLYKLLASMDVHVIAVDYRGW